MRASGLKIEGPTTYRGDDGSWLDVRVLGASPAIPMITKRRDKSEEAWPPALVDSHPNGAVRVSALHLRLNSPGTLLRVFDALDLPPANRTTFLLAGSVKVVVEASADGPEGIVEMIIERTGGESLSLTLSPVAP